MTMWHVHYAPSKLHDDPDDGYVVLADTPEDARALVIKHRNASFRESYPDGDEGKRRWYFWGIYYGPDVADPDTQVGVAEEVGPVFGIPFLGYSW